MEEKPKPWKILSPKIKATGLSPIKSSAIKKLSAIPFGTFCSAYENFTPISLPSPKTFLKFSMSLGLVIIKISLIPANKSVVIG